MFRKSVSKWSIELFLVMFIVTAGVIAVLILTPILFIHEICPTGQRMEIQNVENKINEMKGKPPGYEIVYFEVKDCVERIEYKGGNILEVKYKTATGSVKYEVSVWDGVALEGSGTYPLKVFSDHVECYTSGCQGD